MWALRRSWVKMSGDGGQDSEYEEYIWLSSIVIDHCKKKLDEYE
jgi:hypothetical protein